MSNPYDQFDLVSPLVGMPANGFQYSPAQMAQLNAARDSLRAAENRGEPYTYNAKPQASPANPYDQFDMTQATPANPDAALGGTLQLGVPFTNIRLDTRIPLPADLEAGLVAAGKKTSDIVRGVIHPTTSAEQDAQAAADNAAYAPLAQAHPKSTFAGEVLPYFAAGSSIPAMMALAGAEYGTPLERAARAGAAGVGGAVGKGVARLFGPQSMAGVPLGDAADFANYATSAGNKFGIPTTVGMNGSPTAKLAESVIANMPFVNGPVNAARAAAFQGFNRAVTKTFGEDSAQITPELLGAARTKIGNTIGDIAGRNNIAADLPLFSALKDASQRAATELTPDEAKIVNSQVQNIWNAVDPQTGTIPGTLYKAFQSKMGEIGQNRGGTLSSIMHDTRAALRDAMTRSVSQDDAAAWLQANHDYFNVQQVANAAKATPGSLSPTQLLQAVNRAQTQSKFGGGNDLAELARFAKPTLTDQIPNSGTPQRLLMQKLLTNPVTGLAEVAGLGYGASKTDHPAAYGGAAALLPLLVGRGLAGAPASAFTRGLLTNLGGMSGLLGYDALATP